MDKIIIIGSGLSGLVLARTLKLNGIPFQVFERDDSSSGRTQGWSLNLHIGYHALSRVFPKELLDELPSKVFARRSATENRGIAFVDGPTSKKLFHFSPGTTADNGIGEFHRVNRVRFRKWLLDSLDEDEVIWKKQAVSYSVLASGGVEVLFEDGTKVRGAMVVGADGVNSKICQHLMGSEQFRRATVVNPVRILACTSWIKEADFRKIENVYATQTMSFGRSSEGDGVCLFSTLNDLDYDQHPDKPCQALWSISRYDVAGKVPQLDTSHERFEEAKRWIEFGQYEKEGPASFLVNKTSAEDALNVVSIVIRERKPSEEVLCTVAKETGGRVTLIGDAAHTMTTFRGEGGNHAIVDAVELGEALIRVHQEKQKLEIAVQEYLSEMIPRGQKAVNMSHEAAYNMHNAPDEIIKQFQTFVEQAKASE